MPTDSNTTVRTLRRYATAAIGGWLHSDATVAEIVTRPDFWEYGDLSRDELARLIKANGRIPDEYALEGCVLNSGEFLMVDGCHRWAVATELGMAEVPVLMLLPGDESPATGWLIPDD